MKKLLIAILLCGNTFGIQAEGVDVDGNPITGNTLFGDIDGEKTTVSNLTESIATVGELVTKSITNGLASASDVYTKTETDDAIDRIANSAVVTNALTVSTTNRVASLESAIDSHVTNTNNPHSVTAVHIGAVPFIEDSNGDETAVTIGSRESGKPVGMYSLADGYYVSATGKYSHAEGEYTTASGFYSHAEGNYTTASGFSSHAEGDYTTAVGGFSHAEGYYVSATGKYSHAEGGHTTASGNYSHAEGYYTTASGNYSHAEGDGTIASGDYSHAEGYNTHAEGQYSHAEGYETYAEYPYSHAEGYKTHAEGQYSHAEGYGTYAFGDYSHAEGKSTWASGNSSHADGYNVETKPLDSYSYAWNGDSTLYRRYSSHGAGTYNINPVGGLDGFFIGEQTLSEVILGSVTNNISAENPTFSNAVLSVGLNIDTNSVAVLNEIAKTFGGFPIAGTATTVGGLLAALAAAIAWLKKNKADKTDIEAAIADIKDRLPYALVEKEIENGSVTLDDRADNYVDARTLGSSDSLDIDFPTIVDGKSRDFVLAVECGESPPTISYAAFVTIMAEDASTLAPEQGMNIYSFTEFKPNRFLAARKTVDTVVVNIPESADQMLIAMQKRGIDTTNITDFGVVADTLGLDDTATPQDAIDAVMN